MPRDVQPLDDKQWDFVQKCLHSNEPEFVEMRKKQSKIVEDAVKRAGEINHVLDCRDCGKEFMVKGKYRVEYCRTCTIKLLLGNIWNDPSV